MNEKEHLQKISELIERLSKENCNEEIKVVKDMVGFRMSHGTPELKSLRDIYYFLCGIMFAKGLSDYWNGREPRGTKSQEVRK